MKIEQIKQLHLHSSDSVQQLKLKYHEEDKEAKKHKSPANDTTLRDWELRKYWQRSTWINGKVLSNSSKSIAFTEKTKDNNEPSIN